MHFSSVYSTFNAHKSKEHRDHNCRMFKSEIIANTGKENESDSDSTQDHMVSVDEDI